MSKTGGSARALALLAMAAASCRSWAYTSAKWNPPRGASHLSHELGQLQMKIFWVCVVIGVAVFVAILYSVFAHRRSNDARPADFHASTLVELLWTAIPFVILIALAIPAVAMLVNTHDPGDARTADDAAVGNSVPAPALSDSVAAAEEALAAPAATAPVTTAAEPVASGGAGIGKEQLLAKGEKVYRAQCMACHQADGSGMPPTFPTLRGSPVANGPAAAHIEQILNGRGVMPPFPQLSDEDIAAVATYERVSWGNTGSVVQPAEVTALRK